MKLGIIVATDKEITETKKIFNNIDEVKVYDLIFYKGKIKNTDIILVKCGIGKVNASRTAQILIDKFNIDMMINIGTAGGINSELNIKDIVIGDKLVQYDFDLSKIDNTERGEIPGVGKYINSDERLVEICKNVIEQDKEKDFNYKIGTIASADIFCSDKEISKSIRKEFDAECVEMEGAAIAQVCYLDNIPFVVIRGISDSPNGNNGIDYYTYYNIAARQTAHLLKNILESIIN